MGRIKDLIISMTDSEQYVPSKISLNISMVLLVISIFLFVPRWLTFIHHFVFFLSALLTIVMYFKHKKTAGVVLSGGLFLTFVFNVSIFLWHIVMFGTSYLDAWFIEFVGTTALYLFLFIQFVFDPKIKRWFLSIFFPYVNIILIVLILTFYSIIAWGRLDVVILLADVFLNPVLYWIIAVSILRMNIPDKRSPTKSSTKPNNSPITVFEQLKSLEHDFNEGNITQAEYLRKRSEILGG